LVKQWLKAGYVEAEVFYETESGTPQGGVISPLLANIALDGLDEVLARYHKIRESPRTQANGRQTINRKKRKRYGFIRYADDIRVTAETKEDIEAIVPIIEAWLKQRGLELNPQKTKITPIHQGMDFLGFQLRQIKGHCYTLPHKDKVHA
jgi:RNA-directed DNA polymerase